MTEKIEVMKQLVSLMESDKEAQADAKVYGNWLEHLKDYIEDNTAEWKLGGWLTADLHIVSTKILIMNEFTEQLKLKNIPDAEIGERIKAVVYVCIHFYALAYVSGQTLRNIIDTPTKTLTKEWHALSHALQRWTKLSYSELPKLIEPQSNLQLCNVDLIAQDLSVSYLSEKKSSRPQVAKVKQRSKPKGFKWPITCNALKRS